MPPTNRVRFRFTLLALHRIRASNNGFAMSPDQPCVEYGYCPIACKPGKVMAQWQPHTSYKYPESMNGGLLCQGGQAVKPFPDAEYCVDGTGTVKVINNCGPPVAFCQTVLPGNEAMLIPTLVESSETLAVPGPDYWAGTAAHYYVNAPGVKVDQGCIWGDPSNPFGNWAPYVAGANTDKNGRTFVKIGYNPIWTGCDLSKTMPSFGIKIECPDGGCNGVPCSINPKTDGIGVVNSPDAAVGVGVAAAAAAAAASANIYLEAGSVDDADTHSASASTPASASASGPYNFLRRPAFDIHSVVVAFYDSIGHFVSHPKLVLHHDFVLQSYHGRRDDPWCYLPRELDEPFSQYEYRHPRDDPGCCEGGAAIAGLIVALVAAAALI
ncbi:hypothetical protein P8C59_005547 [Phyllachora maydis]|uniref:Uncharacterized protein n=1 Tax=Phyllachora maydis TaxID=1825666 RepID=A0AAD9I4Z1_9PEZI|nr:hypothetical protein P8C59_005547 [Phyllachora maydis]